MRAFVPGGFRLHWTRLGLYVAGRRSVGLHPWLGWGRDFDVVTIARVLYVVEVVRGDLNDGVGFRGLPGDVDSTNAGLNVEIVPVVAQWFILLSLFRKGHVPTLVDGHLPARPWSIWQRLPVWDKHYQSAEPNLLRASGETWGHLF